MLRKLVALASLVFLLVVCGCVTVNTPDTLISTNQTEFNCKEPSGREYVCYSDEECGKYFRGFGAVVVERIHMQRYHGWYPNVKTHIVDINVFQDHTGWYFLGRIEAERAGDEKIQMKMLLNIYDMDCNLLHEGSRQGQLTQKKEYKKEKLYEQNSSKIKAL